MGWSFMMVALEQENQMEEQEDQNKKISPSDYGCQVLLEKTTVEEAKDKSFPSDARLIWYIVDEKTQIDLVRCRKMSELFDMYYDKYGPGSVQKIDFGYGTVNPKLWGVKPPEKKKRR